MTISVDLTLLIDSVPAYVAYVGVDDLCYRFVNLPFEEAFSRPRDEILGRHIREIIGEENYAFALPYIEEVRKGNAASYVNEFSIAQGKRYIKVNYIPDVDDAGKTVGIIVLSYDITELRETELALAGSEAQYRSTVDAVEDSLVAVDREMKLVLCNESFLQKHTRQGFDREIIGRPLAEALPYIPAESHAEYERIFRDGHSITSEHTYIIEGKEQYAETRKIPVVKDGQVVRILTIVRDLTEKRRLEEELNRVQRLESIGQLAGGIAHDFNNILTSLYGNLHLARLDAEADSEQWRRLRDSEQACQQAQQLSNQLLTFAKGGLPIKRTLLIAPLMEHAASFSLSGSNVHCDLEIPKDLWPVQADEGQLSQVLNNLVINADQAMPEGGTLRIRAENITLPTDDPRPVPCEPGPYLRVDLSDEGVGISAEHLPRIFDPFYSTKQGGSGIGLTTCDSIVRKHGGHITVTSQQGEGSTFHVYLPAAPGVGVSRSEPLKSVRGSGRILFMDDEPAIRRTALRMLKRLGYQVDLVSEGGQAVDRHAEALAQGEPYCCVILDLTVPGGMGGKQCLQEILSANPAEKVVITSGYSNDPIMADYLTCGAAGVLPKPFSMEALGQVVKQAMSGAQGRP